MGQLTDDLFAMVGVWHDVLTAYDLNGRAIDDDPFGGVAGPFPYENLVYCDFDGSTWTQTNVTFVGRPLHQRTFVADIASGADGADDVLRFRRLGPDAPSHVGVSGGPGLIWFVAESLAEPGVQRYCEPDLIRLDVDADPARRWRTTVLWRDGVLVRPMLVEGTRVGTDPTTLHHLDPRDPDTPVHGDRTQTRQYLKETS